ncbi:hypothetical protein BFP97_05875 [Roseivirga sp. 4D4]|uniref:hypothetical protein n=1 Tax=Roseivirga sp. 4D4 TaxID=1889784 RepID=UPI000852D73B|nr:hypothetical protein [Roseivirga sp. 4D4]OEK01063.1 hypothetical protein BFP97_05875 [Roseivirga sp. 4D4]
MIKRLGFLLILVAPLSCKNDDSPEEAGTFIGDIQLQTQAQIEDFGNNGYSTVEGSIRIGGSLNDPRDIVSLTPLNSIDSIKGDLNIVGTTTLTNLGGLQNLEYVGGSVSIIYNADLTSINGIENLTAVGGGFNIGTNNLLQNLNLNLSLTTVGGDFSIGGLSIPNLNAFGSLRSVGSLLLSELPNITDLDGLSNLQTVSFSIRLIENFQLENITGLSNLNAISDITIQDNPSLTSLSGLEGITGSTGLYLRGNSALTDLTGLNNITNFRGNLIIAENANLESLNGLQTNISFVQERSTLSFWSLPKLQSFEAYTFSGKLSDLVFADLPLVEKLPTITQQDSVVTLVIAENDKLNNIDELNEIVFGADIQILKNPVLENVNGLSGIKSTYRLLVSENPIITNVDGFAALEEVIQSITIEINQSLSDFCGLTNAASAGGLSGEYKVSENGFNPSLQDILDGNCSN